jgi:hypothetical protein
MTKTISQKLRELARKPPTQLWNASDRETCTTTHEWRSTRTGEWLGDLNSDEWMLWCLFVACALESEQ